MKQGQSLSQIALELERQLDTRKDYIAKQGSIAMQVVEKRDAETVSKDIVLSGINGSKLAITSFAHDQFAAALDIPRKYYDRMMVEDMDLLIKNVNTWLAKSGDRRRMVRTLDGRVRAFLSDRYRPLDNYDLLRVALPALKEAGAQVVSSEITERNLYVKAIFPELCGEVPEGLKLGEGHNFLGKDTLIASVTIRNSEVGAGSLGIDAGAFKTRCTNLMSFADVAMKKYHVGRSAVAELDSAVEFFTDETRKADDQAFWMKVRDVVAASCNKEVFQAQIAKMKTAAGDVLQSDDIPAIVEVTRKRFGLADGLQNDIVKHLYAGQDMTRWGLLNAITRTAEDQKSYDDATELERVGGRILELAPTEWKTIATATTK